MVLNSVLSRDAATVHRTWETRKYSKTLKSEPGTILRRRTAKLRRRPVQSVLSLFRLCFFFDFFFFLDFPDEWSLSLKSRALEDGSSDGFSRVLLRCLRRFLRLECSESRPFSDDVDDDEPLLLLDDEDEDEDDEEEDLRRRFFGLLTASPEEDAARSAITRSRFLRSCS